MSSSLGSQSSIVSFFVKKKKEKKIRFWMQELKTYFHSLKETYHP